MIGFFNIGRRYELINKNCFYNEYLRDFIRKKPRYGDYFRIPNNDYFRASDYELANEEDPSKKNSKEEVEQLEKIFNK